MKDGRLQGTVSSHGKAISGILAALSLTPSKRKGRRDADVDTADDARRARAVEWRATILPRWRSSVTDAKKLRGSAKLRSLCGHGIPSSVRGPAWKALIGNEHCQITLADYAFLKKRSKAVKRQLKERAAVVEALDAEQRRAHDTSTTAAAATDVSQGDTTAVVHEKAAAVHSVRERLPSGGMELEPVDLDSAAMRFNSMTDIGVDLARTFSELSFFHGDGPYVRFPIPCHSGDYTHTLLNISSFSNIHTHTHCTHTLHPPPPLSLSLSLSLAPLGPV